MLTVSNLTVQFGGRELFKNISFLINPKDRIGLVGKNGVGKTTLMNLISGQQQPDQGQVVMSKGKTIGYLPQEVRMTSDKTIYEETLTAFKEVRALEKEIESINREIAGVSDFSSDAYHDLLDRLTEKHEQFNMLGGFTMEKHVGKILGGLGFEESDLQRPMKEFSGGWQMRIELAKLLLKMPDLLLLDEPTNHLDIESILWLEDFFIHYPGAIMMVSHDKMFLDHVTNRTIEIVFGKIYDYKVPYTQYFELREERLESQKSAQKNQQKYIETTERLINKFRAKNTKASFAQSLIKKLDKLEKIELDELDEQTIRFRFPPAPRSGKIVLTAKDLRKAYGQNLVLENLQFTITQGERIAFVGRNGEGKSTLVKMINGDVEYGGRLQPGHNIELGYYAQIQEKTLDSNLTVLQTIEDEATGEWSNIARIRGLLGAFLFDEDGIFKKVKVLSGGEKSRLALARLLLKPVNLLVLDEPTNHLDISAKEVLKQALMQYDGTLIVVSHDRDFLRGLTNKTYEFGDRRIREHIGDIDEFLRNHSVDTFRDFEAFGGSTPAAGPKKKSANKENYQQRKEQEKKERKLKNAVQKTEITIEKLEKQLAEMEEQMQAFDFYHDEAKANEKISQYEQCKQDLDTAMKEWEDLQHSLEQLSPKP